MGLNHGPPPLAGWTPIRVEWRGWEPAVDWCLTDGVDFVDPVFDQTIERCLRDPFRLLFRRETTMAELAAVLTPHPDPPSGFVLHSSRCGSTLVAQMLSALPSTLVLSEPGPLDTILRARDTHPEISEADQVRWFRLMVAALGRRRSPGDGYVIKLDAWATLSLAVLELAFPGVPTVFLYRDPVEVLVSQLGHRGYHMVAGCLPPDTLGLTMADVVQLLPEEYVAIVLARLLESIVRLDQDRSPLLVDYRELPSAVADRIAPHFGFELSRSDRAAMLATTGRDAKNPALPFTSDTADKQRRATGRLRDYAERWCREPYEALDNRRLLAEGCR